MRSILVAILVLVTTNQASAAKRGHWEPCGTVVFPQKTTQILTGSGALVYFVTANDGIYLSTDSGLNWRTMNVGLPLDSMRHVWIAPDNSLVVQTNLGFYRAAAGADWQKLLDAGNAFDLASVKSIAFDSHSMLYFGTDWKGVFRYEANGSYSRVLDRSALPGLQSIAFDKNDQLLVLTGYGLLRFRSDYTLERSWDGVNGYFLRMATGQMIVSGDSLWLITGNAFGAIPGRRSSRLIIDSANILYDFTSHNLGRSTDLGVTWSTYQYFPETGDMNYMEATTYGLIGDSRSAKTVYRSLDSGQSFQHAVPFSTQLRFWSIFTDRVGRVHAYDSLYMHWYSDDRGRTWSRGASGYVGRYRLLPTYDQDGRYYFMGYSRSGGPARFVSEDEGATFVPPPHPDPYGNAVYMFYPVASGNWYIYTDSGLVWKSVDRGANWTRMGAFREKTSSGADTVLPCVGFAEQGEYVWAATTYSIFETWNNGGYWRRDYPLAFNGGGRLTAVLAGRGGTCIVKGWEGYQWLAPKEYCGYATWVQCTGPVVQTSDSDLIGVHPFVSWPFNRDILIHQTHDLHVLDTLLDGPDSIAIEDMTLDSAGDLLGIGSPSSYYHGESIYLRGIYKFYPEGAGVAATSDATTSEADRDRLRISISRTEVNLAATQPFTNVRISDLLGRCVLSSDVESRRVYSVPIEQFTAGCYLVTVTTSAGVLSARTVVIR